MRSLESRIEDYKQASPKPNKFFFNISESNARHPYSSWFFKNYIHWDEDWCRWITAILSFEVRGCLDYLEIYKPRMDNERPPAESVANCIGTITHIPRIVQDFHTAGLPVWFLRPSTFWDSPIRCNILEIVTPLDPANLLCLSDHYPPFSAIFCGLGNDPLRHTAFYDHSQMSLVFKDPFKGSIGY